MLTLQHFITPDQMDHTMASKWLQILRMNSKELKDAMTLTNVLLKICKKKIAITFHTSVHRIVIVKILPEVINVFATRDMKECLSYKYSHAI